MKRFTAQIRHSYDTILRMCRVQRDTFCFSNKIVMALTGLLLTVFGVWNMGNMVGMAFAMIGCWMLVSLNLPARNSADKIKEQLHGEYPTNGYEFYDKHFVLLAKQHDIIHYTQLAYLVEDDQYLYLYLNKQASFMVEKFSLGDELKAFMAFMEKATGLSWRKPYKLSTFNMKTIVELMSGGPDKKKKKKK